MRFPLLFLAFFISFASVSCKKDSNISPPVQVELKEEKIFNVTYGEHSRQKMDVYLPKGRNETTVVAVILHGGSWIEGDKSDMRFIQEELLKQNIASINMNYRFASPSIHYDQMMEDIRVALSKIQNNAEDWGIRKNQYSIMGYSAGAHLALLYAYGFKKPNEIKTVISVAGPTDLKTLSQDPLQNVMIASMLVGINPLEFYTHAKMNEASPIHYTSSAIPTLFIHGNADQVVALSQSQNMQNVVQSQKVLNKLVVLEGSGHDVTANPLNLLKVLNQSIIWLRDEGK